MANASTDRAEEVFYAALEVKDTGERRIYLERACAGDGILRSDVEKMLTAHAEADRFFQASKGALKPAVEFCQEAVRVARNARKKDEEVAVDEQIGERIGPYKILQKIGEGGCGVVYMAEQERPVRRRVALKVIKLGMDTQSVIARFDAERQALAMMDHSNIARVLDAGATQTGRPYFVMELVRGIRITSYCDENCLDPDHRLDLFIQICHAIQHAHQKGIIHRDIKPSNVLVTMNDGVPVPKVIDFGIAKATGGERLTDKTLFTAYEQMIGTPAYMSPEQAEMSNLDIDTRSDVYSLGVLLYELLTGKTPFDQAELLQSGIEGMRRTLRETEPHRPSTKLNALRIEELTRTAEHRRIEAPRLKLMLSGDLDWIVMKALEKDRTRRYQTANGLSMDIQRYLGNEPVVARPPSRVYRFQKLFRRNKVVFIAGAAVAAALIAGLGLSTWLFIRERAAWKEQSRLRTEAEARMKMTQAAIFVSRGKFVEAEQLADILDVPLTQPSLETAGVFRSLGDWNVVHGNWKKAADWYSKLVLANQVDKSDMTDTATRDLLWTGPSLVVADDVGEYQELIHTMTTRFSATTNPVAAEQVLKFSLILPIERSALQPLEPFAETVKASLTASAPESKHETYMVAWRAFAIALFEYREGNFSNAIEWGQKCLAYRDLTPTRIAMSHLLLAMSDAKIGQAGPARKELTVARSLIKPKFPEGLENGLGAESEATGFSHDWLMAYSLERQATSLIEVPRPSIH